MSAPSRLQAGLVWGAWAALSVALLVLVARYGRNVPFWDDWKMVPVLLGGEGLSLSWLWAQCNEHRLPLSKLGLWACVRLSGGDLRWAMVGSTLGLSALTALLLLTVRRLAGSLRWTDVALPVALLNWGHQYTVLFQIQLHFLLSVALFLGALIVLMRLVAPEPPAAGARVVHRDGLLVALFALTVPFPWASGVGLCLAPVLVLWMAWASRQVRPPSQRRALLLCAVLLAASGAVLLSHLPSSPASNRGFMGVAATAATTLRCLSTALGPVGRELWPWSGLFVAVLGLASVLRLVRVMLREPEQRLGASVLLAGLLATLGLALVIGLSRAGLGWEAGFASRYTTTMVPGLCCAYLAWRLPGTGPARRSVPALLCVALLLALPFNTLLGLGQARQQTAVLDAFATDVRSGASPEELARVHGKAMSPGDEKLIACLRQLRAEHRWLYQPADR